MYGGLSDHVLYSNTPLRSLHKTPTRGNMFEIRGFIKECCRLGKGTKEMLKELFDVYGKCACLQMGQQIQK